MIKFHREIFSSQPVSNEAVSCESGYWKFEKWKWKKLSFTFCSRSEKWNENLIHSFREWKVKCKCLEIEIESEKWNENASRSRSRSEISREILKNQEIKKSKNFCPNFFYLANFYFYFYEKCIFDKMQSYMHNFTLFSREK